MILQPVPAWGWLFLPSTHWVCCDSPLFWYHLPRDMPNTKGKRPVSQDDPHIRCQSQVQVVICTSDQLTINQRFINQIPCLASVNLLEWLKQLRRTHFLARLLSYYKGYQRNWIYSKMKRYIEWGLKHRSSVLVAHGTWHSGTRKYSVSPLWKLSSKGPKSCYFWLLWRLHYIVMTD